MLVLERGWLSANNILLFDADGATGETHVGLSIMAERAERLGARQRGLQGIETERPLAFQRALLIEPETGRHRHRPLKRHL